MNGIGTRAKTSGSNALMSVTTHARTASRAPMPMVRPRTMPFATGRRPSSRDEAEDPRSIGAQGYTDPHFTRAPQDNVRQHAEEASHRQQRTL